MLSAGIVGLPNVGKSTLFNAVTRTRKAQAANYPFCTIEPNQGVVSVPDARLETLGKDVEIGYEQCRQRSSLSISPDLSRAQAREKVWATSFSAIFARWMPSCRLFAVSRAVIFIT